MKPEAVSGVFVDQVGVVERVELLPGDRKRNRAERGPDVRVEIRTRVEAKALEETLPLRSEIPVGEVERRGDRARSPARSSPSRSRAATSRSRRSSALQDG
ncbi:hypothetical protein [Streptomyces sp. NPDC051665]|uniref:hypothetical protein n=1 Tax=Streptomyces sp. NPDC051665 TaxID=3154647 RepID=UPI003423BB52